jgi:hypothetical protein
MKLVFSLALSLVLVITASSTILLTDTPSPVLAQDHGDDDGHDDGGGDDDGHPDDGDDGHDDDGGHPEDDDGGHGEDSEQHPWAAEDVRNLWEIEHPEGQYLGDVQNVRDITGNILVSEDGVPILGRQLFDIKTGEPILNYDRNFDGEPVFITNVGRISTRTTFFWELSPGYRTGPGYERFVYTPPGPPRMDWRPDGLIDWSDPAQGSPSPEPTPNPENQDDQTDDSPSTSPTPGSENQDGQSQETPSPGPTAEPEAADQPYQAPPRVPVPESNNQDGGSSPSEKFDDDARFGEPQPVMDPAGNPRVYEDGSPVLGQAALDEEGKPVMGPNGKPIIVIPD